MSPLIPSLSEFSTYAPHSGQRLQPVFDDARRKIEAIFGGDDAESSSTRIFWVMEKLHRDYPHLYQGELEALLMGLLKHKRST